MKSLIFPFAVLSLATLPCSAALLVYEGFTGYSVANLSLATPNDNTIGLAKNAAYAGTAPEGYVLSAGLNFAGLASSGQAVTYSSSSTSVASAELLLNSTVANGGTLYSSYLVNTGTKSAASGNGTELRISEDSGSGGTRYRSFSDSRGSTTNMGLFYSGTSNATIADSGVALTSGTTYLMINTFANVNVALSVGPPEVAGIGQSFALTETQFATMLAYPGGPQAFLNDAATNNSLVTAYATNTANTGNNGFISGDFMQMVKVSSGGTMDELRYGDSLESVIPVPEPASGLLALFGIGAVAVRRRR